MSTAAVVRLAVVRCLAASLASAAITITIGIVAGSAGSTFAIVSAAILAAALALPIATLAVTALSITALAVAALTGLATASTAVIALAEVAVARVPTCRAALFTPVATVLLARITPAAFVIGTGAHRDVAFIGLGIGNVVPLIFSARVPAFVLVAIA